MEWVKTTQKSVPLFSRYMATKFSLGRYISESSLHNLKVNNYKYINTNNLTQAFFEKEDLNKIYNALWIAIKTGRIDFFLQEYKNSGLNLLDFCAELRHRNLAELSSEEIIWLFDKWVQRYAQFLGYIYNGNFSVNIATQKLLEMLGKKEEDEEFRVLIEPEQETDIKARQKEIKELIALIKEKNLANLFEKEPEKIFEQLPHEIKEKLINIHEKYLYLGSIFLTTNNYPKIDNLLEEIKNLINAEDKKTPSLKNQKQELMNRLNLNKETAELASVLTTLSFYRTDLLSYAQKSEFYSIRLFEEICHRIGISYQHLVHMTYEEILSTLSSGKLAVSVDIIEKRFENYCIYLEGNKVKVFIPEKQAETKERVNSIKGTPASAGKAVGKVKIIRNSSEISKLNKGEILVTFMTTPDFVIAMHKAVAIITNDGGMTCHAAIISRELGIPCIVGTKNATSVFKDGDFVEVDAINGIVRRI